MNEKYTKFKITLTSSRKMYSYASFKTIDPIDYYKPINLLHQIIKLELFF